MDGTYGSIYLVAFILVGPVYNNALKNRAALLCRALRRVNRLCSRTVSDTANRLRKTRKKKSSAVPTFRSGHMSAICARLRNKGKVGVQRGRETAGVPSFLPPRRAPQRPCRPQTANPPAEVQRKTPRPLGANPPAAVRAPRSAGAEKGAARKGRTRLRQFEHPAQPVQRKEPPRQGEHAYAVRAPRSAGAEKFSRKFSKKLTIHGQFSPPSGIGLKEVTQ